MSESLFEVGAPGIETERLAEEIRDAVAEKAKQGRYTDVRAARSNRTNFAAIRNRDDFLPLYIECLRDSVYVDINDFEVTDRRRRFTKLLILLKRVIWKMLKFYTYRLWSQQNQVNGLLLSAIEGTETQHRERIAELEERIATLEAERAK